MKPNRKVPLLLGGMACLFFFALWARNLGYPELTEEEAFVDTLATQPTGAILQHLNVDEPHPPLFYLMQHGWTLLGGSRNEFLVRFPSVFLGVLLLCLTYRLGRATGLGWPAALTSAIWLGLNPQITYHVREARMYPLMAVTVVLAALVALHFEQLPRRAGVAVTIAATSVALLSHYFNALFVGVIAVWGLLTLRGPSRRRWLLAQVVAWVIFAVWTLFFGHAFLNPASLGEGKTWSFILPPWDALAGIVRSGLVGYRDIPAVWVTLVGGGLLVGLWLIGIFSSRGRVRLFLLSVVAVPLMVYALGSWLKPIYHPKYVVPWLAFAAVAFGWLLTRRPRGGAALLVATLAFMALPTWRTIQLPYYFPSPSVKPPSNEWLQPVHRQFAEYLKQYADSTDVFGYHAPSTIDCYYADTYIQRSLGCHVLIQGPTQSVTDVENNLVDLLNQHAILWYRELHNASWDPVGAVPQALTQHAIDLGTENTTGIPLHLYAGASTILSQQQPAGVRFGDMAQLEGFWLTQRGDLHVALVWRSLADHPSIAAKVFVHLISASGDVLSQMDNVPVSWTRPLATWQLNEQLLDVYALSVPIDNTRLPGATLQIGMYDPDTGARFPVHDRSVQSLPDNKFIVPLSLKLHTTATP